MRVTALPDGRRRARCPLAAVLLAGAVVLAALVALSSASAATLPLQGGTLTSVVLGHPCPGAAAATTSGSGSPYSAVSIVLPAGCGGRPLALTVLDGSTVLATGTSTAAASGATVVSVAPGTYAATPALTVRAVVDGWDLPTTWSFSPAVPLPAVSCRIINHPTATCAFEITSFTSWADPWPGINKFELNGRVVGLHNANSQEWELTVNFGDSSFPFVPKGVQSNGGLILQSGCAALPTMTVRGNPGWAGSGGLAYHQIRSGQTRAVYLQGYLGSSGNLLSCP